MTYMPKKWYRSRKSQFLIFFCIIIIIVYYNTLQNSPSIQLDVEVTRRSMVLLNNNPNVENINETDRKSIIRYIEESLQESLKEDLGTGCNIPKLDPFAKEILRVEKHGSKITCFAKDWARCYLSECRVDREILDTTQNIICTYNDIIYLNDQQPPKLGPPTVVRADNVYELNVSDHVKISCTGTDKISMKPSKWTGYSLGFRTSNHLKPTPPHRENTFNVLILGFDSTSHNGFIRQMPKSYKYLTDDLHATVLNGYNILGDGTPAALFPILTGKNELEYPDVRKAKSKETVDFMPFIFYKMRDDGYRTAYFEDMPWIGTFQYRFNGFKKQPADHYLRAFYLMESHQGHTWWGPAKHKRYCVGDTPRYQIMLNITDQFFQLDRKKFCFTFIADITHDNSYLLSNADDSTFEFLKKFYDSGRLENTLVMVMGDHGSRFSGARNTLQGKLEERLPFMAILLPEKLKRQSPSVEKNLQNNADVLTTPHDIHATILDVVDMKEHWNLYQIPGATLKRGLTLLEPIPSTRSCSEAGVEAHWCVCLSWKNVTADNPLHKRSALALLDFINELTEPVRSNCVPRTLVSIKWVMVQHHNKRLLSFSEAKDNDGYVGNFNSKLKLAKEIYQLEITVGPANGIYEATMSYFPKKDKFEINTRDISRTNAYGDEPHCISSSHPHLNMFCYCKDNGNK